MDNVSVIARNENACKLLDCLVAYRRLISSSNAVESGKAFEFDARVIEFAEAKPQIIP